MAEQSGNSYIELSRHGRRAELAKLAEDRQADMSVVVGLSWRIKDHQAHVDYAGGLDTTKIREGIASLGRAAWRAALPGPRFSVPAQSALAAGERQPSENAIGGNKAVDPGPREFPAWRDALAGAAPVDLQRRDLQRRPVRRLDHAALLERVDTEAMASLARGLLEERLYQQSPSAPAECHPLPRVSRPFFGSGHAFFAIQFGGSGRQGPVKWIMKIPSAGAEGGWDWPCREALRTEAFLLHTLRTETTVPVPEVIDADCRADNEIGAPWLLMEFIQGRRLEDAWFGVDHGGAGVDASARTLEDRRETILRNMAEIMLQLGRYRFDRGGAVSFDAEHGHLIGVQALRELDVQAMLDRWFRDEECPNRPLYRAVGPWETTTAAYTAMLDAYRPMTVAERGVDELLRLLVDHVREPVPSQGAGEGFVLTHPDLSLRNVLVADDGTTIKALLGWDGARAVPHSLGNEALPRWLVRDFNPFVRRWQPAEADQSEDPPWVLRVLRDYYSDTIRELKGVCSGVDVTRQSLLTLTLDAAIRDPRCRSPVLRHLLEKCSRPFEELDFASFVDELGRGYKTDAVRLKCLADNIGELLDLGFVKGAHVW